MNADKKMWAMLIQLGTHMWYEYDNEKGGCRRTYTRPAAKELLFDRAVWKDYAAKLRECGCNTLFIDIGEGMIYDTHPELAIPGSLTKTEVRGMLGELKEMGFAVYPKLNFSTTHDFWLKDYSQMISTPLYYKVCAEIIDEVCELFADCGSCKYIHIGMDEEGYDCQRFYDHVVIRQNETWWKDLYWFVEQVERNGARACIWSDYARHRPDEFVAKCPKSVVQCVWYYFTEFENFSEEKYSCRVMPFGRCEEAGYDQLPCGSIEYFVENFELLTEYCTKTIADERLIGFMQTTWMAVNEEWRGKLMESAETIRRARELYGRL